MLRLTSLLLVFVFCFGCEAPQKQVITTLILVRHAEKQISEDNDPDLTPEGYLRAEKLKQVLGEVEIDEIFSSEYKRTIATAAPIAKERGLEIKTYDPRALDEFSKMLLSDHAGKSVLISGHSNTTPRLINQFIGQDQLPDLTEKEYDWVYIVDVIDVGNVKVKKLKITL